MAYSLSGKKSGAISFLPATGTITQETMTKSSKMTSNAIEGGSSIEDHVYLNPEQFQIVGVVVKNHSAFRSRLKAMWKNRDLVTYVGKFRVENYVIISLQMKNDSGNRDGFSFTATLQKANIVSGAYVEIGQEPLMSKQDSAKTVSSAGLKTTVSKQISQSAYAAYVSSYNGKSSSGPTQRKTASYNGV